MHCESLALDFRLRFCAKCFYAVCTRQRWTHLPHGADGSSLHLRNYQSTPSLELCWCVCVCFFFVHTLVWFFMCHVDGTHVKHIFPCEHVEKKNKDNDEEERGKKEEKEEQISSKARDTKQ